MRNVLSVIARLCAARMVIAPILAAVLASHLGCEAQVSGPLGITPSSAAGGAPVNPAPGGTGMDMGGSTGNGTPGSGSAVGVGSGAADGGNVTSSGGTGTGSGGSAAGGGNTAALPCEIQTLFMNRCQSCHGGTPAAGVPSSLVTYLNLTAAAKSDPTKTEAVMALSRMQNASIPMPPLPGTPATTAEVNALQGWIAAGYPSGSCGGQSDGGVPGGGASDGGAIDGGATDTGTTGDPFNVPPTCTSKTMWTRGDNGSASMNPGTACINCHSKGEGPRFTIAGTVYPTAHEPDLCNGANGNNGARVEITGADGKSLTLTPNPVGNFSSNTTVATPYRAKVTYMGRERLMIATQTSGDCNSCHSQAGANSAPGRLLLP